MSGNGEHVRVPQAGFWKLRHAVIGLAVIAIIAFLAVRGCSGEPDDEEGTAEVENALPTPARAANRRSGYPPAGPAYAAPGLLQPQPGYVQQPPAYGQPQPGYVQQPPAYGQSQPGYVQPPPAGGQPQSGYAQQPATYGQAQAYGQQPPQYGYSVQPQVLQQPSQAPVMVPGNPWATQPQPAYGGSAPRQPPAWGQPRRQPPAYSPASPGQYRPLAGDAQSAQPSRQSPGVVSVAPRTWPAAPYDQVAGSSFDKSGQARGGYPYGGAVPGYPGGMPYGAPGYGYGWPGGGLAYPGLGVPGW